MELHLQSNSVGGPCGRASRHLHAARRKGKPRLPGNAQATASASVAAYGHQNRQKQRSRRQEARQVPGVFAIADADIRTSCTSSPTLFLDFLEYGVCREQYFSEVSLPDELAKEARLIAQTLVQSSPVAALLSQELAEPILDLRGQQWRSSMPALTAADLGLSAEGETACDGHDEQSRSTAGTESMHEHSRSQPAPCPQPLAQIQVQQIVRTNSLEQLSSSGARRRARRSQWQHCAVAGAVVGVEAGAIELAVKRRLQAERRRSTRSATAERMTEMDAVFKYSHPILQNARLRSQCSQAAADRGHADHAPSALDQILGYQGQILTRQEELQLVKDMQGGLAVQAAIDELQAAKDRQLTAAELMGKLGMTLDEIAETLTLGLKARHALMHANKRLVFKLAHSFGFDERVPFEEYVLAGMEGLVRGLLKFDPRRGHKLSSLLVWWIRCSVSHLATTLNRVVHIPHEVQYSVHKLQTIRQRLLKGLHREPTDLELQAAMRVPLKKLEVLQQVEKSKIMQLEDVMSKAIATSGMARAWGGLEDDSGLGYGELLQANEEDGAKFEVQELALADYIEGVLALLPPKKSDILRATYGTGSPDGTSRLHREVAHEWGLTPRRVGQIRAECLEELRTKHWDILCQAVSPAR